MFFKFFKDVLIFIIAKNKGEVILKMVNIFLKSEIKIKPYTWVKNNKAIVPGIFSSIVAIINFRLFFKCLKTGR